MSETRHYGPGSDEGGAGWARMASLIETCKLNQVNPQRYLTDVLTRLVNGWSQSRIDELMPWHLAIEQVTDHPAPTGSHSTTYA